MAAACRAGDPRLLVHFEPQPVPRPVAERLAEPVPLQHVSRRRVDLHSAATPGPTAAMAAACASRTAATQPPQRRRGGAKLNGTRKIHAVSVVDPPEVQHHPVARLRAFGPRPRVRQGAVGARRDYRLEGRPLNPAPRIAASMSAAMARSVRPSRHECAALARASRTAGAPPPAAWRPRPHPLRARRARPRARSARAPERRLRTGSRRQRGGQPLKRPTVI